MFLKRRLGELCPSPWREGDSWALNGLQRFCCSSVSGKGSLQQEVFVFETNPSELVAWQCCVITALYGAGCIAVRSGVLHLFKSYLGGAGVVEY